MHTAKRLIAAAALMGLASAPSASVVGHSIRGVTEAVNAPGFARNRGKGKSARAHDNGGTKAYQRAALKKRNKARHRKACKS